MSPHSQRGRKRLDRERYPSGQVRPETFVTGVQWQRMRMVSADPRLSTNIGRLAFLGKIDPVQAATAERISKIYGRFDRAMGRSRFARSPSYELGRGSAPPQETEDEAERTRRAIRAMSMLESEIGALAKALFPGLRGALEELCVEDRLPTAGALPFVREALQTLSDVLGVRAQMAARRRDSRSARGRTRP